MASLAPRAAPSRELLATLSATQRQDLKFLSRLCEPAVISAHEAPVVGCSCCPPFDMCLPTSDGAVRGEGDVFPIVTRSTGAFSGPGQREYAVTFDGCEPHSSNWGGTALYRESPEGLLFLHYESGIHPSHCETVRMPDAHDVLLCQWPDGHQGHERVDVYQYDFAGRGDSCMQSVYSFEDSSAAGCFSDPGTPVLVWRVGSVASRDLNGDGLPDVHITASRREGKVDERYLKSCNEWQAAFDRWDDAGRKGPQPKSRHVELLSAEERLKLDFIANPDGFGMTRQTRLSLGTFIEP